MTSEARERIIDEVEHLVASRGFAAAIVADALRDRDLVLSALGGVVAGWRCPECSCVGVVLTDRRHHASCGRRSEPVPVWVFPSPTSTGDEQ